jgi:hypothetical protein
MCRRVLKVVSVVSGMVGLDPEALKPGSNMPSFAHAIDRRQAEELARYVKKLAAEHGG